MHTGTASAPVCTIFFLRSAQLAGLFQRGVDCIGQPLCCCLRRHALLKDLSDGIDHSLRNAAQRYRRECNAVIGQSLEVLGPLARNGYIGTRRCAGVNVLLPFLAAYVGRKVECCVVVLAGVEQEQRLQLLR